MKETSEFQGRETSDEEIDEMYGLAEERSEGSNWHDVRQQDARLAVRCKDSDLSGPEFANGLLIPDPKWHQRIGNGK